MNGLYRICSRCVLDTSDPDITFDKTGVCNHCNAHDVFVDNLPSLSERKRELEALINKIKFEGRDNSYDCVMGISGGVDSSYMAYLIKIYGLRPYIIHVDNGWNAEMANDNIRKLVSKLDFKLHNIYINWEEFNDLQKAFFEASVIDIEMITDHAIAAVLISTAKRKKIKYIMGGSNAATESGIPASWSWLKSDLTNIKAIHRKYGRKGIESIPTYGTWKIMWNRFVSNKFSFVYLLDYIDYKKNEAMDVLSAELDWQYYGGKHYESLFTKFYQAYILPDKFGVDKRRAHFSSLIRNGEMSREEAIRELEKPPYDPEDLLRDKKVILEKLGFSEKEFENIMKLPPVSHSMFLSDIQLIRLIGKLSFIKTIRKLKVR